MLGHGGGDPCGDVHQDAEGRLLGRLGEHEVGQVEHLLAQAAGDEERLDRVVGPEDEVLVLVGGVGLVVALNAVCEW